MTLFRFLLVGFACLALSPAGCTPGPKAFAVEGTLVFEDGKPAKELAGGTVSFESVADQSNAAGEIHRDGTFRLTSPLGSDGVPAGEYRVLVLPPEPRDADNPPPPIIPIRYYNYQDSGLRVTVEAKDNVVVIPLRRK